MGLRKVGMHDVDGKPTEAKRKRRQVFKQFAIAATAMASVIALLLGGLASTRLMENVPGFLQSINHVIPVPFVADRLFCRMIISGYGPPPPYDAATTRTQVVADADLIVVADLLSVKFSTVNLGDHFLSSVQYRFSALDHLYGNSRRVIVVDAVLAYVPGWCVQRDAKRWAKDFLRDAGFENEDWHEPPMILFLQNPPGWLGHLPENERHYSFADPYFRLSLFERFTVHDLNKAWFPALTLDPPKPRDADYEDQLFYYDAPLYDFDAVDPSFRPETTISLKELRQEIAEIKWEVPEKPEQ